VLHCVGQRVLDDYSVVTAQSLVQAENVG
jgi:hypothetical protein